MVDLFKLKTDELKTLVTYKKVLESDTSKFPKDFWTEERNQVQGVRIKCRILTRYCLENLNSILPTSLSGYYLKQIKDILVEGRLFSMVQAVFRHDVLAVLKNAYPEEFKNRTLKEWMWSKHGVWEDDRTVIEAVKDMVYREGLRRPEQIPTTDWKKKLLEYRIYNVLSRFNWSIFRLFDFVYPNRFHPSDFKYKIKWALSESLENAFYHMHTVFKKQRYDLDGITMLSKSDFRRLGLAGMLNAVFNSSALMAKEYYLYKTVGNEENQKEINETIRELLQKRRDEGAITRLRKAAVDKYIYNLHSNYTLYGYVKRHARENNLTIHEYISKYGFVYKSSKKYTAEISKDELWKLRQEGLTYVEIAKRLNSNPTSISELCRKHFGGDPLIPRPIEDYTTVQELMDQYHVDHKTVMKLARGNGFQTYTTVRLRYIRKSEIIPVLEKYIKENKSHLSIARRYSRDLLSATGE